MATPAATDADLQKLRADILEHGVATWQPQLDFAASDILNWIKSDWWPQAVVTRFGPETVDIGPLTPPLDVARINDAVLVNLVCYWAMAQYIYPSLTIDKDVDGDSFTRRAARYGKMYGEELARVRLLPLYDFDGDSAWSDIERRGPTVRRLTRG